MKREDTHVGGGARPPGPQLNDEEGIHHEHTTWACAPTQRRRHSPRRHGVTEDARSPVLRTVSLCASVVSLLVLSFQSRLTVADEPQREATAIRVGTLHVGDGTTIAEALVVVEDGKFSVVGAADASSPLSAMRRFPNAHAAPGFVDGFTRLGLQGGAAEDVEVLTPLVRASDAFDASDPALRGLAAEGVTTIGFGPEPGNVAAGSAGAARLGGDRAEAVLSDGPMTFSFTRAALRADRVPATLAGARRLLEAAFAGSPWTAAGERAPPVRGDALAALRDLRPGLAHAWCDTPASARAAVETLRAKRLEPVLVGLRDCAAEPDALASLGAACVVTALRPEDPLALLALPARLHAKGVPVSISTGAPDRSPRSMRLALSLAVAAGLPGEAALSAATSAPARALGLGDRVGRVAPRLDADLVVTDGPPWEVRSRVLLVLSAGRVVYDRAAETAR